MDIEWLKTASAAKSGAGNQFDFTHFRRNKDLRRDGTGVKFRALMGCCLSSVG